MSKRRRPNRATREAAATRAADAAIETQWARIPALNCQGKCHTTCGPVDMSVRERERILERHGVDIPHPPADLPLSALPFTDCPALTMMKTCGVYEDRPTICFLPDAYVYTEAGPRRIAEILAGDRVYGADGRLHRVLGTTSRWKEGQIVNVRHSGTHVPCWSTTDHLWLCATQKDKRKKPAPQWKQAGDLVAKRRHQTGDYLTFPGRFEDRPDMEKLDVTAYAAGALSADGAILEPFTARTFEGRAQQALPAQLAVDDEFLYLLGMYLAEGSASNGSATFTLAKHEEHIAERLTRYLATIDVPTRKESQRGRNVLKVVVCSALFARLMHSLAGAHATNKRIAPAVFGQLSHRQLWSVFQAWNEGDGRKCFNEQQISVSTTSQQLVLQMSFAALANGYFPRIYRTDRPRYPRHPAWDLNLFPSNWRGPKANHGTRNMADEDYTYTPATDAVPEDYAGPVIDIQVEGAQSFVTSSGIAHNCRLWGATEDLPCMYGCQPIDGTVLDSITAREIQSEVIYQGEPSPRDAELIRQSPVFNRAPTGAEMRRLMEANPLSMAAYKAKIAEGAAADVRRARGGR